MLRPTSLIKTKSVLILADIEGSSGCWSYGGSSFLTREWARACEAMTLDVAAVVAGLAEAGVSTITVKDFHRTGYNLLAERVPPPARVVHGFRQAPVAGLGNPGGHQLLMLLGMHAASGGPGFLPHTLTSRLKAVRVNGRLLPEVALFSAIVASWGLRPVFFSGCPVACRQARNTISGIDTFAIDKKERRTFEAPAWRRDLARSAVAALGNRKVQPYAPAGPFEAEVVLRDGPLVAAKLARRWRLPHDGDRLYICSADIPALYDQLVHICYLQPWMRKLLPVGLALFNLRGWVGLWWVRRYLKQKSSVADYLVSDG